MMRAVGLDLSLTATGVAVITDTSAVTTTIKSKGHRADSLTERRDRIHKLTQDVFDLAHGSDLVVIEGPSVMSKGGSNWDRAGYWWEVIRRLLAAGESVAVAAPTVVKKFAAGRGNADKAAVAVGIARLWPAVEPANDNEFDALTLATIGAQRLGMDVPDRAHHAAVLTSVAWPERMEDAA